MWSKSCILEHEIRKSFLSISWPRAVVCELHFSYSSKKGRDDPTKLTKFRDPTIVVASMLAVACELRILPGVATESWSLSKARLRCGAATPFISVAYRKSH